MAAADFFVPALLESIRDRCMLPSSDDTLNDARMLRLVNDELQGYMSNLVVSLREEFLVQHFDVGPISTGGRRFRIPSRASASAIRDVKVLRGGTEEIPTVRLELDSKPDEISIVTGYGYWLEGDDIVFNDLVSAADVVRFRCAYMPKVVYPGDALPIATIAADRRSFTFDRTGLPTAGTAPGATFTAQPIDFIRLEGGNYPRGLSTPVATVTGGSAATGTVTLGGPLTTKVPDDILVGHFAAKAGTSPVAAIPEALQPVLAQRVAYVALRAIGDPKAEASLAQLVEMKDQAITLMRPRTEAQPRYLINRYAAGWRR